DQVTDVLHAAYAEGRIDNDEHDERVLAALRAKTFDDLIPLTADLVPTSPVGTSDPRTTNGSQHLVVSNGGTDEPDRMTAALSEVKRVGKWRMRRRSNANVFLGSVQLDLTEAAFESAVVEVNVTQFLGSVFLRVPVGVTVRDETAHVLGEASIKGIGEPDPAYPTIVLRGTNVLGEIKVRGPKKPPPWRKAIS
ncbi:MAG: DUF1707 domain-containing protein, partial [Propionibacteriaceae bacterium]